MSDPLKVLDAKELAELHVLFGSAASLKAWQEESLREEVASRIKVRDRIADNTAELKHFPHLFPNA